MHFSSASIRTVRKSEFFSAVYVSGPSCSKMDSAIQWINHYPLDNAINFDSTYSLDSDLSRGQHYPPVEQEGQVYRKPVFIVKYLCRC